jgi:hypothetical protein
VTLARDYANLPLRLTEEASGIPADGVAVLVAFERAAALRAHPHLGKLRHKAAAECHRGEALPCAWNIVRAALTAPKAIATHTGLPLLRAAVKSMTAATATTKAKSKHASIGNTPGWN